MKYAEKYGVSRASRKYNKSRSYIYFWKARWDGSVAYLACQSRRSHSVAGAITQPFAEMVWATTGGDMETVNRLTDVLVTMNTPADREKLFKIIKLLYGLMGLRFSEEAEPMDADPDVLEYFIFSFTADFGEVILCFELKQRQILPGLPETNTTQTSRRT